MQAWIDDVEEVYESVDHVNWAFARVAEYNYRKMFGLSKKQFLEEPTTDFITNAKIAQMYRDREKAEVENSKSKR